MNIRITTDTETADCGSFESAFETLGKMERRAPKEAHDTAESVEDHDCHAGPEHGCPVCPNQ